jgi:hypothetical protein
MFYNARWYDPYLNRFVQPDSIVPVASQGVQAYDRYCYVSNNPVRYNDPSGHCPICVVAWIALNADAITTVAISAFVAITAGKGAYDAYQAGDTNGALQSAAMIPIAAVTGNAALSSDTVALETESLASTELSETESLVSEEAVADGNQTYRAVTNGWSFNWKPTRNDINGNPPGLSCSVGCQGMTYKDIFNCSFAKKWHRTLKT